MKFKARVGVLKAESTNDIRVEDNKVNLCDSCEQEYAECPAHGSDILFGDGFGKDNVVCCACYRPIMKKEKVENVRFDDGNGNASKMCGVQVLCQRIHGKSSSVRMCGTWGRKCIGAC